MFVSSVDDLGQSRTKKSPATAGQKVSGLTRLKSFALYRPTRGVTESAIRPLKLRRRFSIAHQLIQEPSGSDAAKTTAVIRWLKMTGSAQSGPENRDVCTAKQRRVIGARRPVAARPRLVRILMQMPHVPVPRHAPHAAAAGRQVPA